MQQIPSFDLPSSSQLQGRLRLLGAPLIVVLLVAAVAIVSPWREFSPQDDGWAYARSVEWLLSHGQYRLDPWSAANMPVQIYLAAGLAKVFGYSLSLLRLSTLLLLAVGLGSFFALLRELGIGRAMATAATLALAANPLVLMLAFTFMSDVQFMGWLCAALFLYVRGIRRGSDSAVLLASAAAACAIGTRQFGLALIPALAFAWLASSTRARPPWRRLAFALALPLAVTLWQLRVGLEAPNVTQSVRLQAQAYYSALPLHALGREAAWRIGTIWHYLGIATLAAVPLFAPAIGSLLRACRGGDRGAWLRLLALTAIAGYLAACTRFFSPLTSRNAYDLVLPLWWMLPNAFWDQHALMRLLDSAGLIAAALLAWPLVAACRRSDLAALRKPQWLLLGGAGAALLCLHLAYVQLNDTYIVGMLPFALLVPAVASRRIRVGRLWLCFSVVLSAAIILAQSIWLRGEYNLQEAQWKAADDLLATGVTARCIAGTRHWSEYHGAFDDWVASTGGPQGITNASRGDEDPLHDPFYDWMETRSWKSTYHVSSPWETEAPRGWALMKEIPYRDALLADRTVLVFVRTEALPVGVTCESSGP